MTQTAGLAPLRTLANLPNFGFARMTDEESNLFIRMALADMQSEDIQAIDFEVPDALVLQILAQRIKAFAPETPIRKATILFVACLCDLPGQAVMWAYYLVQRARQIGGAVTMSHLADDFPVGFPNKEAMSALWDEQKGAPGTRIDNRLDHPEAWAA